MSVLSTPQQISEQFGAGPGSVGSDRVAANVGFRAPLASVTSAALRKAVFAKLNGIVGGKITVVDRDVRSSFGQPDSDLQVVLHVTDPRFYRAVALGGSIGAEMRRRHG